MQDATRATGRPGERPGETVPVRLPDPTRVFAKRAARLRALAPGHAIGDFLQFLGRLADAQDAVVRQAAARPAGPGPLSGPTPLSPTHWRRDEAWRIGLQAIVSQMRQNPPTPEATSALDSLTAAAAADLETRADAVLARDVSRLDAATAPIVAAALQVHWAWLASQADAGGLGPCTGMCPLCGAAPVAGIVRGAGGPRYLACPLCATEWHHTRVTCSVCGGGSALSYLAIDEGPAGVKAEACGACRAYLKLFYLEDLPSAEPVADDVASLALDMLMAQDGYSRAGANWLLS